MFNTLEVFKIATDMARHAGQRQALVARNVANADTPGFRASTLPDFKDAYAAGPGLAQRMTRAAHLSATAEGGRAALRPTETGEPSPNGNTVSIEDEMLNAVNVSREHSRALTIYRHGMTVLRSALGR